jgi:hypothetical protein
MKCLFDVCNFIYVPCSCYVQVSLASLGMYVLVDPTHILDAEKAFVSLSLFYII